MRLIAAALALSTAAVAHAQTPSHVYLMDDANDLFGGAAMTTLGGDFSTQAGRYTFSANQGFSLENVVNTNVYTIDFGVSLDTLNGYRRLVDFKNLGSDTGFYNLNARLNFYNVATGPSEVFVAGQDARVTLTRDAAGFVTGYVDGVQQFQFDDSTSNIATFSAGNSIAYFFRDDNAVSGEASAGSVDYLSVYNTALTAGEVANLTSPVPEPTTGLLLSAGIGLFALLRRRRD